MMRIKWLLLLHQRPGDYKHIGGQFDSHLDFGKYGDAKRKALIRKTASAPPRPSAKEKGQTRKRGIRSERWHTGFKQEGARK